MIDFGIVEDPSRPESTLGQVRIVLSPRGAKTFSLTLGKAISDWEKATGIEIVLSPEKIAQIETAGVIKKVG